MKSKIFLYLITIQFQMVHLDPNLPYNPSKTDPGPIDYKITMSDFEENIPVDKFREKLESLSIDETPLFMPELKFNNDNIPLGALQAILEEGTAEERAANFKTQGNECYVLGTIPCLHDAIKFYTRGIDLKSEDQIVNSTLHLNRCAAYLALEQWTLAAKDAKRFLDLAPAKTTKSCLIKGNARLVKASLNCGRIEDARKALDTLKELVQSHNTDDRTIVMELEKETVKAETMLASKLAEQRQINSIIEIRRQMVCSKHSLIEVIPGSDDQTLSHFIDDQDKLDYYKSLQVFMKDGKLKWPIILFYPSNGESDVLLDVGEEATISNILDTVFEDQPSWDTEGAFKNICKLSIFMVRVDDKGYMLYKLSHNKSIQNILDDVVRRIDRGLLAFYVIPLGIHLDSFIRRFSPPVVY